MGLSSAVLFIFISLLIQSRANQEVKGQSKDFLLCDRVKVSGISKLQLGTFFSIFRVTVVPSVDIPERLHSKILVCFHRNNALGRCHCKKDEWKAIQKGRWSSVMSPYEDRYVDVKFIDGVNGSFFVTLDEDSQQWRLCFMALGFALLLLAPIVSGVPFYYTTSMDIGVFLVILSILFKVGTRSFLLHHFSVMVNSVLLHFGMSEEMYYSVTLILLVGIVLSGAAVGFWVVRNAGVAIFVNWAMRIIGTMSILQCTLDTLGAVVAGWTLCSLIDSLWFGGVRKSIITVTVEGRRVDVGVARFVKWAMRIIGTMSILLCTIDTPLALGALVACWTLCSLIHSLLSGGVRYQTFGFHNEQAISNPTRAEFLSRSSAQQERLLGSSNSRLAWSDSPLQEFIEMTERLILRRNLASTARWALSTSLAGPSNRLERYLAFGFHNEQAILNPTHAEFLSRSSAQQGTLLGSSNARLTWSDSPLQDFTEMTERLILRRNLASTAHQAPSASRAEPSNWPERSPPPPLGSDFLSIDFRNLHCQEQYDLDLLHCKVTLSKTVDFTGWESLQIKEMFDRIGLQGMYSLRGKSCDRIVRLFYANMSCTGSFKIIKTYILGKEIVITPETINQLIGFAVEGAERYYYAQRKCSILRTAEGTEFIRQIHRNSNIVRFVKPEIKDLNVKARVVHKLVTHIILPRAGHRDHVNYMCLYVMEKLYSGRMFDPGFMILSHMREIGRTRNKNLPYNVLIQKIIEHFEIQLPSIEQLRAQRTQEAFGKIHLVRMGLVETNGIWTLKGDGVDDVHAGQPTHIGQPTESDRAEIESLANRVHQLEVRQTESHREVMDYLRGIMKYQQGIMEYQQGMMEYQRDTRQLIQEWMEGDDVEVYSMEGDDDDAQPIESDDEEVQLIAGDDDNTQS